MSISELMFPWQASVALGQTFVSTWEMSVSPWWTSVSPKMTSVALRLASLASVIVWQSVAFPIGICGEK